MIPVVLPRTTLSGRDRFLLRLVLLLKPEATSVRVSLAGRPGEVTAELERVLRKLVLEQSHSLLVDRDDVDSPLLAAQYALGIQ